jgi:hypothetical protein
MGKIAFVFPGQGAQYPGMGKTLVQSSAGKHVFDKAERLRPGTRAQCFSGTEEELKITENHAAVHFAGFSGCCPGFKRKGVCTTSGGRFFPWRSHCAHLLPVALILTTVFPWYRKEQA